jgi:hypothetical protein
MTAETLTGARAAAGVQPYKHSGAGLVHAAWGHYSITDAALEDGDIFKMCKLPKGALVIGGMFHCADLDTGTEAVDIDVGWADNGGASATFTGSDGTTYTNMYDGSASATGFVNSGVLTGDAITDLLAAGNNLRPFPMTNGPVYFSEETTVQIEVNAAQATPAAGVAMVVVYYVVLG